MGRLLLVPMVLWEQDDQRRQSMPLGLEMYTDGKWVLYVMLLLCTGKGKLITYHQQGRQPEEHRVEQNGYCWPIPRVGYVHGH